MSSHRRSETAGATPSSSTWQSWLLPSTASSASDREPANPALRSSGALHQSSLHQAHTPLHFSHSRGDSAPNPGHRRQMRSASKGRSDVGSADALPGPAGQIAAADRRNHDIWSSGQSPPSEAGAATSSASLQRFTRQASSSRQLRTRTSRLPGQRPQHHRRTASASASAMHMTPTMGHSAGYGDFASRYQAYLEGEEPITTGLNPPAPPLSHPEYHTRNDAHALHGARTSREPAALVWTSPHTRASATAAGKAMRRTRSNKNTMRAHSPIQTSTAQRGYAHGSPSQKGGVARTNSKGPVSSSTPPTKLEPPPTKRGTKKGKAMKAKGANKAGARSAVGSPGATRPKSSKSSKAPTPGRVKAASAHSKGTKHRRHKSSPNVLVPPLPTSSTPQRKVRDSAAVSAASSPQQGFPAPVASNHWRVVTPVSSFSEHTASTGTFVVPSVQVSPLNASSSHAGRAAATEAASAEQQHEAFVRHSASEQHTTQHVNPPQSEMTVGSSKSLSRNRQGHRRVRSADGASKAAAPTLEGWQDPPHIDSASMDAALQRLKSALQQLEVPDGAPPPDHDRKRTPPKQAAAAAPQAGPPAEDVLGRQQATSPSRTLSPETPPPPAPGAVQARAAVLSHPAPAPRPALEAEQVRRVRSVAGPLRPVLSDVHVPKRSEPTACPAQPAVASSEPAPLHAPEGSSSTGKRNTASQPPVSNARQLQATSEHGDTAEPPSRPPKLSAAQEAAATIRAAASAKATPQSDTEEEHSSKKNTKPEHSMQSPPLPGRGGARSAQFLAAQAGLQAVIAKQQAASILSPADIGAGRPSTTPEHGRSHHSGAAVRTSNPLAPHSSPASAAGTPSTAAAAHTAGATRVLPPVPARRKIKQRPQSEPSQRAAPRAAPQRSAQETALSEKAATRRAAALNELVSSEVVYISKLQQLVRVFEGKLAPGGAADVQVPNPPQSIVGGGPFLLTAPDDDESASNSQQGSSTPGASQIGTPAASPEHSRSKSAGSRRFSWLGGARDPSSFLSAEQHSTLFRAVHTLLPLHFDLLQQLHEAVATADQQLGTPPKNTPGSGSAGGALVSAGTAGRVEVGDVMYQFSPFFKMYNQYVAGHSAALTLLGELTAAEGAFAEWLRRTESSPQCGGQTLGSFLIMPVQRIPRYALLLKELLGHTPTSHCDHRPLTQALAVVENSASRINTAISEHAFRQQVVALQAALSPSPNPSLVGPSTKFVLAGWLHKVTGGTSTREYLVVLLSDCLVYASVSKNTAQLQAHREAYEQAMQAAVDSSDDLQHAVQRLELPLERGQLKLHNRLHVSSVGCELDTRKRHCLKLQAQPKSVQFVCQGALEAAMWESTLQGVLQEQQALQERRRRGSTAPSSAEDASPAAGAAR